MQTLDFSAPSYDEPTRISREGITIYSDEIRTTDDPDHGEMIHVTGVSGQALLFDKRITLEEERLLRLRKYRLAFGIASLACMGALLTCVGMKVPYEPAAAMTSCCVGIFAVFIMKVKDAKR